MDDLLQFINLLFCGGQNSQQTYQKPDAVLLTLFRQAGQTSVSCLDPDERTQAAYPRLILSGEEGEQHQTGDADATFFMGTLRLEIVTRQTDTVPDELDLLDQLKARVTDLLLGNPSAGVLAMQGQVITVGQNANSQNSYNLAVFYQCRPTGRMPVQDPTIKRWGATYRVTLHRLGFSGLGFSGLGFSGLGFSGLGFQE